MGGPMDGPEDALRATGGCGSELLLSKIGGAIDGPEDALRTACGFFSDDELGLYLLLCDGEDGPEDRTVCGLCGDAGLYWRRGGTGDCLRTPDEPCR